MANHPNRAKVRPQKLFLVCEGDEENNRDLFVRAAEPWEALSLWRRHYEAPGEMPVRIITVPDVAGPKGAVSWAEIAAQRRREARQHGLCHDCRHNGSDCQCHRKDRGWLKYEPAL